VRATDRLIARTVRHSGPWLAVLVATAVVGAALQLAFPFVLGSTIDSVVTGAAASHTWLARCVAIVVAMVACEILGVWATGASGAQASAWLRQGVVRHVLGVGPAMTRRFADGDLVTRLGLNAEEMGRAPEAVVTAAVLLIPTVGSLVALALIDLRLPLALVAGLILITLVLRAFLRDTTTAATGYQTAHGDIAARLIDALAGARTIAAAGTAEMETRRVLIPLRRLHAHGMELWRITARAGVQAGLMIPLLEVVVLGVGGLLLTSGDLTVGELYAAARYVVLGAGLSSALGNVSRLARARGAAGRLLEAGAERPVSHGVRILPAGPGTLEFRGVALPDDQTGDAAGPGDAGGDLIDVIIPGGSATAVVGRSGTGKSLFAAVAGRLLDPRRGIVALDGVPLHELSRTTLRHAIGYAFDRPVLVGATLTDATLTDAIGLGLDRPDPGLVATSARAACAETFIRPLPRGYATPLREAPLSGGERQRVGLARAFAHGERVLILDDATSSLDTVTERQVSAALTRELGGRTRLIVAHRVATAASADRVIWLEDGRVRAYDHHRVLWRDPAYRAIFQAAPSGPDQGPPAAANGESNGVANGVTNGVAP
jgi:ATP-binding cassette subfamily B protein